MQLLELHMAALQPLGDLLATTPCAA